MRGSNWMWFLAGAFTGAALALLYAPASGEETRRFLGQQADRGRRALAESGQELLERSRELYEKGKYLADEAAELYEQGRRLVQG